MVQREGDDVNSRIKKQLCLRNAGQTVDVKGPILKWDPDEVSAIFSVVVSQMNSSLVIVSAAGVSGKYAAGALMWEATADAVGGPLELGPATATATATIENNLGQLETYAWGPLYTHLVECNGEPEEEE